MQSVTDKLSSDELGQYLGKWRLRNSNYYKQPKACELWY